jgi:hypothetical protein
MSSTGPAGVIFTVALALGKHVFAPAETTMLKVTESSESSADAASGKTVSNRLRAAGAARKCSCLNILLFSYWQ